MPNNETVIINKSHIPETEIISDIIPKTPIQITPIITFIPNEYGLR